MDNMNIYESIGKRTGGDIYIGVVGPVRAGKSTFIKRFMDIMVLPNVKNDYERQRIRDELPQSGSGKSITTTEPKFIPAEAAEIEVAGKMSLRVRLVDCVGYLIPGAVGHMENGEARMVATPWSEDKMPFEAAAELGTEKVIKDHSTVGIVVTSDGSIGTMERSSYEEAEKRTISGLRQMGKPFVVILNSTKPRSSAAKEVASRLSEKYGVPVIRLDCARASEAEIGVVMEQLLGRFPVREILFQMPGYVEALDEEHWFKKQLIENVRSWMQRFDNIADLKSAAFELADGDMVENVEISGIDMGTGEAEIRLNIAEDMYYGIVTELMETPVENDYEFFKLLREFTEAKKAYDKLRRAMEQVEECGYGIVEPKLSEMVLETPEIFKQGNKFGVKIKAKAPTLHIISTDITTEISPVVGSEKQSQELVDSLKTEMEDSPGSIWDTNIFGKSLYEMVAEQMENKIAGVPDNIRVKMQKSLQKISDEGKEYFICIVL